MILPPNLRSFFVPERTTQINRLLQCNPRDKGVGVRCYGVGGDPNSLGNWEWYPQQGTSGTGTLMQRRPGMGENMACSGNVSCAVAPVKSSKHASSGLRMAESLIKQWAAAERCSQMNLLPTDTETSRVWKEGSEPTKIHEHLETYKELLKHKLSFSTSVLPTPRPMICNCHDL